MRQAVDLRLAPARSIAEGGNTENTHVSRQAQTGEEAYAPPLWRDATRQSSSSAADLVMVCRL